MPHTLEVFLRDRLVGSLTNFTDDHTVFVFDPEYAEDAERSTLSLGFHDAARALSMPANTPQTRLLPFFANLLPEGHLREHLAERARVNQMQSFSLLRLLGEDLPGAVRAREVEGVRIRPQDAASVVLGAAEANRTILKFSLAGAHLKYSVIQEGDGGLAVPPHGRGGDWILKMPSPVYAHLPENEFAMMTFARRVGIEVPEIALIDSSSVRNLPPEARREAGRALAVKRFDRADGRRVHAEDFNQIYNQYPDDKYKNVSYGNMLADIWRVMGEESAREFVRRLVFSMGIGNGDMHLKNWSVVYPDGKTARLAPAYDYVSTVSYMDGDALALTAARSRQWSAMTYDHLERFARRAGVPRGIVLDAAREMVGRMRDVWPRLQGALDVSPRVVACVDAHMGFVPLFS